MWRDFDDMVATLEPMAYESSATDPVIEIPADEPERLVPELLEWIEPADDRAILALFCFEEPTSVVGRLVANLARALATRDLAVHVFSRRDFELEGADVASHALGDCKADDLAGCVQEFAARACAAFTKRFPGSAAPITLFGFEWSTIPAMMRIREHFPVESLLSLHSVERQRSDMTSLLSKEIEEHELAGVREAKLVLMHDSATTEILRSIVPECSDRILPVGSVFPAEEFSVPLDPGSIKGRYGIAPLDPVILYVGDLDERYGPDLLVKALPAVVKNHRQAKLIVVGEGSLYWPLRVYQRYLLLEPAIRLLGHVEGHALRELIQAADMVVVPSRAETPWWPIQAAWAAGRPVVATHQAAAGLLDHEADGVLVYPSENSLVWGIERVLFDAGLRESLAARGRAKLEERFGRDTLAAQIAARLAVPR